MITLRSVTLQRGAKRLLDDVNLTVFAPQKIGVVGANGSGKSSLMALLLGELHSEAGDVEIQPGLTIAQVAQETPAVADPAPTTCWTAIASRGDRGRHALRNASMLRTIDIAVHEDATQHHHAEERDLTPLATHAARTPGDLTSVSSHWCYGARRARRRS
jgi:ATPase subunit of ABC transporter with duplicated ATPase domains